MSSLNNLGKVSQDFQREIGQARNQIKHHQTSTELEQSIEKLDEMNVWLAKQIHDLSKMKQQMNLKERIKKHKASTIEKKSTSTIKIQPKIQEPIPLKNQINSPPLKQENISKATENSTQVGSLLSFEETTTPNNTNTMKHISIIDNSKHDPWEELNALILPSVRNHEITQRKYLDPLPISDLSFNSQEINSYTEQWDDVRLRKISNCKLIQLPNEILIQVATFSHGKDVFHLAQCNTFLLRLFFNQTPRRVEFLSKFITKELWSERTFRPISMRSPAIEYLKDEDENFQVVQDQFWKSLTCYYFPNLKIAKGLTNWIHILRRRVLHLQNGKQFLPLYDYYPKKSMYSFSEYEFHFIENCEWIYKCPLSFYELSDDGKGDGYTKFCTNCGKHVYRVTLPSEVQSHALQGHCIALDRHSEDVEMGFVAHW